MFFEDIEALMILLIILMRFMSEEKKSRIAYSGFVPREKYGVVASIHNMPSRRPATQKIKEAKQNV